MVIKIVEPGNCEILKRDTILLNLLGRFLGLPTARGLPLANAPHPDPFLPDPAGSSAGLSPSSP